MSEIQILSKNDCWYVVWQPRGNRKKLLKIVETKKTILRKRIRANLSSETSLTVLIQAFRLSKTNDICKLLQESLEFINSVINTGVKHRTTVFIVFQIIIVMFKCKTEHYDCIQFRYWRWRSRYYRCNVIFKWTRTVIGKSYNTLISMRYG